MKSEAIKANLQAATAIAKEQFGENPPPEIIAAILNAMTAERINSSLDDMTDKLCQAAAVAAGH